MSAAASEIEQLARQLWGKPSHSTPDELRFGQHGSKSVKLKDRTWFDHEANEGGGYVDLYEKAYGTRPADASIAATYDYHDADGNLIFQVVRKIPKKFVQRRPDGNGGWIWDMKGVERVPYRLPELLRATAHAPIFICEGEKDCDNLRERGLIATTNPGGAGKWSAKYNVHFLGRRVAVLSDNDPQATTPDGALRWHPDGRPVLPGQDHAADVAQSLRGSTASVRIVMLPDLPPKGDVSDWLAAGGTAEELESLAAEVLKGEPDRPAEQQTEAKPRGKKYGRLLVLSVGDLDTAPRRAYLLKGIMSPGELSLWVGPPKCGKSFLMLYIAYLLSLGLPVFGRRVRKCKVLYVAAEGQQAIEKRIEALRNRYGNSSNFHYIAQHTDLLRDGGHKDELKLAAKAIGAELIILDTLNRILAGGDENSSVDMGTLVMNMTELREETGAHVAGVHHGTKADGGRGSNPRGHSCLTGADDVLIEVAKHEDGTRSAKVVHAKDDADGHVFGFKLDLVELGQDEDGDPITTLIVEEMEAAPQQDRAKALPANEQIAVSCLDQALKADGTLAVVGEAMEERRVTTAAAWRQWFYRTGKPDETQDTRKKAFNRAKDALIGKGRVASQDDYVWRPEVW